MPVLLGLHVRYNQRLVRSGAFLHSV